MTHLKMHSMNKIDENVLKIARLFPNCVTEAKADDGTITHKIDFDMLKQELSHSLVEGREERYQFTWPDKKQAILTANAPINKTLRPCREESVNFDETENLYIEGDNLEVLKLLQETYLGKIKMIYIDPPYNTGNDFVYNDDFSQDADDYMSNSGQTDEEGNRLVANTESNGRFHTDWLNMMYPRLKLARDLLSDDGVIFISIDENESHNLRKICDEIFGNNNYFGDLIWESTTQPSNAGNAKFGLQQKTEVIFLYGKNKSAIPAFKLEEMEGTLNYPHNGKFGKCRFEIIEKSDAGNYNRPTMKFKILGQYPREGKRWQIGEETARLLEKEGKVEIVDGIVKRAIYPEDEKDKIQYKPFWSLIRENKLLTSDNVQTALNGKEEVNTLFETSLGFDTIKPTKLLKKLIFHVSSNDNIILDFFSGSATTAHAVMQLNAEDGGNRKFIMVQLPEATDEKSEAYKAGYKNICEIGKERIRRAGKKIIEEDPLTTQNLDIGFRVLKCDTSNMEDVYYTSDHIDTNDLFKNNIKSDRTPEDLLFQVMLDLGIMLSSKIETKEIDGKTVFYVEGNYLVACFDENVDEKTLTEIAKEKPYYFVMRDASMANDSVATNFEQIFKTYLGESYNPDNIRII
ncbi:site-specific DNA-methyltransferase [uncultured Treponema sp.]|uniref:site-specific DNA-methyltransferase n=1 Tax=uncultured Treponema sp. TaxID=162155 RepID=UPI002592217B|nr:site-specific DNA-methyltransferase [uncultured Treponema sp.]